MGIFTTVSRLLRELNRMRSSDGRPDMRQLFLHMRDIEVMKLNMKNLGYQLGRTMLPYLDNIPFAAKPARSNSCSKACTQEDVESPWFRYWCKELKIAPCYHRKLWEFALLLQTLFEQDLLVPGKSGIGFGCGEEPLASYFASKGIDVLVTDLELERVRGAAGWRPASMPAASRAAIIRNSAVGISSIDMFATPMLT